MHLAAVLEVAQHIDELSDEDRKVLRDLLPDIAAEIATPRTQVGIVKMKGF
jgi:hypothetical protein